MTEWTALVPLKNPGLRKSRLRERLSVDDRIRLTNALAHHVTTTLLAARCISSVVLLSDRPAGWAGVQWLADGGQGLNVELQAAAALLGNGPLIILPADLPWLQREDVEAMIDAAGRGSAIAPDRHGLGTNGLALTAQRDFSFSFGERSFRAHLKAAGEKAAIVRRPGLAFDIDTPNDLDLAMATGIPFKLD